MNRFVPIKITDADHKNGFTGEIQVRENALLIPPNRKIRRERQVVDETGNRVIYRDKTYVDEDWNNNLLPTENVEFLEGNWVFGGFARKHFGHFVVEGMSTVWALDHIDEEIAGVMYLPFLISKDKANPATSNLGRHAQALLKSFKVDTNVALAWAPTRVEKLYMGEVGFGMEHLSSGSEPFRKFFRSRHAVVGRGFKSKPRKKLYVSRSKVGLGTGHLVGEKALEKTMAASGYEIFWPEEHPVETQLATYRAAEKIVGVEGSALHVPPFAIQPDAEVAIITRRWSIDTVTDTYGAQYKSFAGIDPVVMGKHFAYWQKPNNRRIMYDAITVADFDDIYGNLIANGFLPENAELHFPRPEDLTEMIAMASKRHDAHLLMWEIRKLGRKKKKKT